MGTYTGVILLVGLIIAGMLFCHWQRIRQWKKIERIIATLNHQKKFRRVPSHYFRELKRELNRTGFTSADFGIDLGHLEQTTRGECLRLALLLKKSLAQRTTRYPQSCKDYIDQMVEDGFLTYDQLGVTSGVLEMLVAINLDALQSDKKAGTKDAIPERQ